MFSNACCDLCLHISYMCKKCIKNSLCFFFACMIDINCKKAAELIFIYPYGTDRHRNKLLKISWLRSDLLRDILHHCTARQHWLICLKDRIRIITVLICHSWHDLISCGYIEIYSCLAYIIRAHIDPDRMIEILLLVLDICPQVFNLPRISIFILLVELQICWIGQICLFSHFRITLFFISHYALDTTQQQPTDHRYKDQRSPFMEYRKHQIF